LRGRGGISRFVWSWSMGWGAGGEYNQSVVAHIVKKTQKTKEGDIIDITKLGAATISAGGEGGQEKFRRGETVIGGGGYMKRGGVQKKT